MNRGMSHFIQRGFFVILILAFVLPAQLIAADDIHETQGFRRQVTLAGIRKHQAAFQSLADANGRIRVAGSAGYDASAQYVYNRMVDAEYNGSLQEFTFNFEGDATPPVLEQISPTPTTLQDWHSEQRWPTKS